MVKDPSIFITGGGRGGGGEGGGGVGWKNFGFITIKFT